MFAGFLVVFLVELADQFLEDRAHGVVVHAGMLHGAVGVEDRIGAEIDFGIEELADERAERVGLGERGELVAEFEVLEDVLNVRREAVQVVLEVGEQLLLAAAGFEVAQGELRGVVERLARGGGERGALLGDAGLVEHLLGFEHGLLRRFQHGVHAAQDAHGQDDVGIFAALEEVAQHVVGDAPDEGDDFVVSGLVHDSCLLLAAASPPSMNETVANYSIVRIFWNGKPMPLPIVAAARRPRLFSNHFYPRSRFD